MGTKTKKVTKKSLKTVYAKNKQFEAADCLGEGLMERVLGSLPCLLSMVVCKEKESMVL